MAAGADRVTASLTDACAQLRELAPLQRALGLTEAAAIGSPALTDGIRRLRPERLPAGAASGPHARGIGPSDE